MPGLTFPAVMSQIAFILIIDTQEAGGEATSSLMILLLMRELTEGDG